MLALLPRLRRFACALTGSVEEGEDLVQATCERAIRYIGQWQPGTRLDSWMFQIARNLNLNNIRARKVRGAHLAPVDATEIAGPDPHKAIEADLTLEAVRRFVQRLPEEQRTILLLVCVEGLAYKEVAELLDLPMGTVTSRLARARIALKELIEGKPGAVPPSEPNSESRVG
jgi:RNA polymerase sigma-70 factor (ECF subfamily)